MRRWHFGVVGVVGLMLLSLTGCPVGTSGPGGSGTPTVSAGDGTKLKKDIVGKWEGKSGDTAVSYDFKEDGKYDFEAGKTKFSGDWKAVNDTHIELKFKLTKDEADALKALKPVAKAATKNMLDAVAMKTALHSSASKPEKAAPPVPKEGENTWMIATAVNGDELTLGSDKFKKKK